MKKSVKKILVTGGAGFIGSHIVDELIKHGNKVVVLDDLSGGFEDNVNLKAVFIKGSITNTALINDIFKKHKVDYVFHLAAYAAEGLSHFIRKYNYENNLIGSVNLINAAVNNNVKCFVFTSSMAVYGKNQVPMKEFLTPNPEDPYGVAKLAVEQDLESAHKLFGLNYIIFRPHNVYGERQNIGDKYRNVVGIFMNQIMQNKSLTIFGNGLQKRAFTYIKDVAPVIAKSIDNDKLYNKVFNIGADKPYTIKSLAIKVSEAMGVEPNINYLPSRFEVKNAFCSHARLKRLIKYKPHYSLEDGLKIMARWAKRSGSRESSFFQRLDINYNLPKVWIRK